MHDCLNEPIFSLLNFYHVVQLLYRNSRQTVGKILQYENLERLQVLECQFTISGRWELL